MGTTRQPDAREHLERHPERSLRRIWMSVAPAAGFEQQPVSHHGNGIFDARNTSVRLMTRRLFPQVTGSLPYRNISLHLAQPLSMPMPRISVLVGVFLVDQLSGPYPHLVIGGGKDGYLYLLNRDAMEGWGC